MKFEQPPRQDNNKKDNLAANTGRFIRKVALGAALLASVSGFAKGESGDMSADSNKENIENPTEKKKGEPKSVENVTVVEGKYLSLEMENYFETDRDDISKESQEKIKSDFINFLNKITEDNIDQVVSAEWTIFGSSDERPTKNFGGSNENLTSARISKSIRLLKEILNNYKFSNLSKESINKIKNIEFKADMPQGGKEKGVTYITEIVNPKTGKNFTQEEVEELKKDTNEYNKYLSIARSVNLEISVKTNLSLVEKMGSYEKVLLSFDNSPSVSDSYQYMVTYIKDLISKVPDAKKISLATFSDRLGELKTFNNTDEIIENINTYKYNGSSKERILSSTASGINTMKTEGEGLLISMTDEPFQDVSLEKINTLIKSADEKSVDVLFCFSNDLDKTIRIISLGELKDFYMNQFAEKLFPGIKNDVQNIKNNIKRLEREDNKKEAEHQKEVLVKLEKILGDKIEKHFNTPIFSGGKKEKDIEKTINPANLGQVIKIQ